MGTVEAANVDSPIAQAGERIAPVELKLDIEPGVRVEDPTSPTHQLNWKHLANDQFQVSLTTVPNKDFVLRYNLPKDTLQTALFAQPGNGPLKHPTAGRSRNPLAKRYSKTASPMRSRPALAVSPRGR